LGSGVCGNVRRIVGVALCVTACGKSKATANERSGDGGPPVIVVHNTDEGLRITPEVEPNENAWQATDVAVPGAASGHLAGPGDVDCFRIRAKAGAVAIKLSGAAGVDLVLELRSAAGEVLATSDRGPAGVMEGLPNWRVHASEPIVVVRAAPEPAADSAAAYEIVFGYEPTPGSGAEREPNDTAETAGELLSSRDVTGLVGWQGDWDFWAIDFTKLPPDAHIDIDVGAVAGVKLEAKLLDGTGKLHMHSKTGGADQPLGFRGWLPTRDSGIGYFLAVGGRGSNPFQPYAVNLREVDRSFEFESEPNDELAAATVLAIEAHWEEGSRRGFVTPGDVDYFAIPVGARPALLHARVETRSPRAPDLQVVDADSVVAADLATSSADSREMSMTVIPADTPLFMRVANSASNQPARFDEDDAYTLHWVLVKAPRAQPTQDAGQP
jgi:hypothetical protein